MLQSFKKDTPQIIIIIILNILTLCDHFPQLFQGLQFGLQSILFTPCLLCPLLAQEALSSFQMFQRLLMAGTEKNACFTLLICTNVVVLNPYLGFITNTAFSESVWKMHL